ncbi:FecR family protein [Chryseolinea sp. T2]|uniref:FecR family protein n=1 Tax=Chryseolinea sp. T2 TaxID=3129255 RepID=UPI00307782CA
MERYLNYSCIEFVHDDDFLNWVNHGKYNILLDQRWRNWIDNNPHKADDIEEARLFVLTVAQEPSVLASRLMREEVWRRIETTLCENDAPIHQPPLISRWYSKLAVAIGLIIAFSLLAGHRESKVPALKIQDAKVETGSPNTILVKSAAESKTLVLTDGSSIVLMPGSTLEYPRDFGELNREVYLSGEAYFEVSAENNQPFVVNTSSLTLAALGTNFNVRSYETEDDTRIQVKNGRASVSENTTSSTNSIVLLSNHQIVYRHSNQDMVRSLVDNPGILVPVAQANFVFEGTPITAVLKSIGNAYGIDISFNEWQFSGCNLNADLNELPLYGKLKTICDKVACTYEVVDERIVMHGGNCGSELAATVNRLKGR